MTIKAGAFSPCFEWSHWKKSLPTLSRRTYSGQLDVPRSKHHTMFY